MVSTRGVRYKFSEGERVLCYEPDPTKAKVLYDSKNLNCVYQQCLDPIIWHQVSILSVAVCLQFLVENTYQIVLEVIESKDKRGRRTVEYLIHFQGWNSSWDRCVGEDFVLKDTEENRQLQRDLAEKSQLQLGAYLYRRERKKGSSTSGPTSTKRARHGYSDDGSSSPPPPDGTETCDTDSSSGDAVLYAPPPHLGRAHIPLPNSIRERLTFDYHYVVKRGRLAKLPASPTVADILESFVKWYARAGAWHPQRGRHDPPHRPDLMDVSCRLNLMREIADGIRIYFDFTLPSHLLYKQEQEQYYMLCGRHHEREDALNVNEVAAAVDEILKSPKLPEYSHLPPDPIEHKSTGGPRICVPAVRGKAVASALPKPDTATDGPKEEVGKAKEKVDSGTENAAGSNSPAVSPAQTSIGASPAQANTPPATGPTKPKPVARAVGLARRLRSHKSLASHPEAEDPTPSTSTGEPREALSSSVGSSASSVSESWVRPNTAPAPTTTRTPLSLLLDKVSKWQIISREGTEHLPCRVYGATHLARLFVKLPEFLGVSAMPETKVKLVIKHIEIFISYLEEHSEWFGDSYYDNEPAQKAQ